MKRSKERSILDFCVGNTHISAGHTCHMLASFFLQIFSFLRVISRQETSLPLLDPRSAYTFISSGWLFPEASLLWFGLGVFSWGSWNIHHSSHISKCQKHVSWERLTWMKRKFWVALQSKTELWKPYCRQNTNSIACTSKMNFISVGPDKKNGG